MRRGFCRYLNRLGVHKNRLVFRFIGWFFLVNALVCWVLGFGYLKSILSSGALFENSLAVYTTWLGKCLIVFFALVNYFSYMMLLAFIPAVFVGLFACFAPSRRFIGVLSVLIAALGAIFLIADSRVYALFRFHLNTTLLAFVYSPQWRKVFDFSTSELVLMMGSMVLVLIMEGCIAWVVWKKIILTERFKVGKTISVFWSGGLLFSYFTLSLSIAQSINLFSQQTPHLPLYSQLLAYVLPGENARDLVMRYSEQNYAQPLFPNFPLRYPLHPLSCKLPDKPYHLIIITIDSLRADSLQSKYMPNVANFGQSASQFQKHMSGGNATQPGLFSLFYSLPSSYWTAALEHKKPPVLIDLLVKYGYETQIFWSTAMSNPPFDKTIFQGIAMLPLNGAPGNDMGSWDRYITKKAIQFLSEKKHEKPFFLHLFYNAPHGFCSYQSFSTPFQPALRHCVRLGMSNDDDPLPYYNRYLNAVNFIDGEVGKVLGVIQKLGYLDNSIVILTSDHGQEFNDNHQNYWGHSGNFTTAQVQVPLIIHWPGDKPRKVSYLTTSYDVVPTLLRRLFSCTNPIGDYSIGQDLLAHTGRPPFVVVGSYVNMGLIEPDRITTLEVSGRVSITDKKATPLPNAKPRMESIHEALVLMRKYFYRTGEHQGSL